MVSQVKLIAEPWDVGAGGYQVGNFPPLWTRVERQVPRHRARLLARRARHARRVRLAGSPARSDLYQDDGRRPYASINFVTAHDGFTLRDLVSYNEKHNEANGEDDRDGESHNRSWNCGVEGPTDDPAVLALRGRQQRNFLATLLLSQGVPMLLRRRRARPHAAAATTTPTARTTRSPGSTGTHGRAERELLEFTAALVDAARTTTRCSAAAGSSTAARSAAARRRWPPDIAWFTPDGAGDDRRGLGRRLRPSRVGVFLNGEGIPEPRRARRAGHRRLVPAAASTPTTRTIEFTPARRGVRRAVGRRGRHRGGRGDTVADAGSSRQAVRAAGERTSAGSVRRRLVPCARAAGPYVAGRTVPEPGCEPSRLDLPPAAPRRLRPSTTPPTCADYLADARRRARSTSRRCCRRRRAPTTATTSSTPPGRPRSAAARTAAPRWSRPPRARGLGRARRHRAEPHRRRRARGRTRGGGTCCGTGRASRVRALLRHRLGPAGPAAAARCWARDERPDGARRAATVRRRDRAALLRAPLPDRARHRTARQRRARCTTRQHYRAGQLAARRRRAELPAVLRRHHARRRPRRGPRGVRRPPTPRSLRWVRDGPVDGLRVDHPDGLADPGGYLDRLRAAIGPDALAGGREDPRAAARRCPRVAGRRHDGYDALPRDRRAVRRPGRRGGCSTAARRPSSPAAGTSLRRGRCTTPSATVGRRRSCAPRCAGSAAARAPRRATADARHGRRSPSCSRCFPVYRSYLPGRAARRLDDAPRSRGARRAVPTSPTRSRRSRAAMLRRPGARAGHAVPADLGPVMAKGVEDTAFYR